MPSYCVAVAHVTKNLHQSFEKGYPLIKKGGGSQVNEKVVDYHTCPFSHLDPSRDLEKISNVEHEFRSKALEKRA
jgi:hypothetical protein